MHILWSGHCGGILARGTLNARIVRAAVAQRVLYIIVWEMVLGGRWRSSSQVAWHALCRCGSFKSIAQMTEQSL